MPTEVVVRAEPLTYDWRMPGAGVVVAVTLSRFARLKYPVQVGREREMRRRESRALRGICARAGRPSARVPGIDVP